MIDNTAILVYLRGLVLTAIQAIPLASSGVPSVLQNVTYTYVCQNKRPVKNKAGIMLQEFYEAPYLTAHANYQQGDGYFALQMYDDANSGTRLRTLADFISQYVPQGQHTVSSGLTVCIDSKQTAKLQSEANDDKVCMLFKVDFRSYKV